MEGPEELGAVQQGVWLRVCSLDVSIEVKIASRYVPLPWSKLFV